MAVTIHMFSHFPESMLLDKFGDFEGETTLKCMLLTDVSEPSQDDDDFHADVVATEIADSSAGSDGYATGGKIMTTTEATIAARVTSFDAANVAWTVATITARYAVIYDYTGGSSATNALVCYIDFGENKVSENGTFEIQFNASGIFTVTVAAG